MAAPEMRGTSSGELCPSRGSSAARVRWPCWIGYIARGRVLEALPVSRAFDRFECWTDGRRLNVGRATKISVGAGPGRTVSASGR